MVPLTNKFYHSRYSLNYYILFCQLDKITRNVDYYCEQFWLHHHSCPTSSVLPPVNIYISSSKSCYCAPLMMTTDASLTQSIQKKRRKNLSFFSHAKFTIQKFVVWMENNVSSYQVFSLTSQEAECEDFRVSTVRQWEVRQGPSEWGR